MTELDPEQTAVAGRPFDSRTLVVAGPGTGKTHTLIARAASLGERGDGVIALSFTRAVVREIQERVAEAAAGPVRASTIDGFAARLLLRAGGSIGRSFDDTVGRATKLLEGDQVPAFERDHVLVDEVQDLNGVRMAFVLAVLDRSFGWTAFGDPQQAIYDFQGTGGEDVFDVLRERGAAEHRLTRIHRAHVAEQLAAGTRTGEDLLRGAGALGDLPQLSMLLRRSRGDAAVLTRTNGEALRLAQSLADLGAIVDVRQEAGVSMPPPWIARLATAVPGRSWTRGKVGATLTELLGESEAQRGWVALRRIAADGSGVSVDRLRQAIVECRRLDDFGVAESRLSVSAIHRAKGLEWDDVIVLRRAGGSDDDEQEARVDFVAATRARQRLWRLQEPRWKGYLRYDQALGRWLELGGVRGLEVRVGDLDSDRPPGDDACAAQDALSRLEPGSAVRLVRRDQQYEVVAAGATIGATADVFGRAVERTFRRLPDELSGARILGTRTAAGDPDDCAERGLPASGLWIAAEIVGLVREKNTKNGDA